MGLILALAIIFRLLAAIFARGWGMLDDHFLIIEAPQSWVFGYDYNNWLPGSKGNEGPSGHNFFYPGLHFLFFHLMKWLDIRDPQVKMLLVRLIHGGFSLITVWAGFRITEQLSDRRSARMAGILLALYFFMPWISVRNLAEAACIPFVMLGFLRVVKDENRDSILHPWLISGLWFGLAADVRYQLVLFPAGLVLLLLLRRQWRGAFGVSLGVFLSFGLVQTLLDLLIWGRPFAEVAGYIAVNVVDRNSYFNLPWYNYFLTVGGILLPPVSLFFFYSFFRGWKRYAVLFVPAALFFAFHSVFPNKQERFILPFLPLFIIIGSMGYYRYVAPSAQSVRSRRFLKGSWVFFWTVNLLLLCGVTFMYSKRARVESMYYLSKYPYLKNLVLIDEKGGVPLPPLFYCGKWPVYPDLGRGDTSIMQKLPAIGNGPKFYRPQFVIFWGERNLALRVAQVREIFPDIAYETTIEPGFIDILMHRLNPVNKAEYIFIYRNREFYPERAE